MNNLLLKRILFVFFIALFLTGCTTNSPPVNTYTNTTPQPEPTTPIPTAPATTEGQTKTGYDGVVLAGDKTPYLDFIEEDYLDAVSDGKIILLYFYSADNCPICLIEKKALYDAFDEMSNSNMIGFRVNFEDANTDGTEETLAQNLEVEGPHTKVILKNGKVLQIVTSTWDKSDFINQMTRYLE